MRTRFLEPKSHSSPSVKPGQAMAKPRPPMPSYAPETSAGRRKLRSAGPLPHEEPEEWEEEYVDYDYVEDYGDQSGPPHGELQPNYVDLGRQVASELKANARQSGRDEHHPGSIFPESGKPEEARELSLPLVIGGLVVVIAVAYAAYANWPSPERDPIVYDDWLWKNLTANMRTIRSEFPSQANSTWLNFASGIHRVLTDEPTEPSVFLLVHGGGGGETSACLARKVARVAHELLEAPASGPLEVEGSAMGRYVDGLLVTAYKPLVERHGTLVLKGLQSLPADVARGLHIFCDTVTPLVRKAVYVFTLDVGGGVEGEGSVSEAAQRGLYAAWERLDTDILAPLVARVMGGFVLAVVPEEAGAGGC